MSNKSLDAAATLPPVNLTPAQAVAVALAMALAAQADPPHAVDGRAALEKLLDVMELSARQRAERLAGRVWVRTPPAERSAVLTSVEEGLAERGLLVLRYRDRLGRPSHRRVEPHLLTRTDDQWYLVGWCQTRRAPRWFRWDRIEGADLTTEPVPDRDPAVFGTPPLDAHLVR